MTAIKVATACNITMEVCQAVGNKFLSTPDKFKEYALDMEELWQFPLAFFALNSCHIPIRMLCCGAEAAKE